MGVLGLDGNMLGVGGIRRRKKPLEEEKRIVVSLLRDLFLRATVIRGDRRAVSRSSNSRGGDGRCGRGRGSNDHRRKPINLGLVVIHLEQLLQPGSCISGAAALAW